MIQVEKAKSKYNNNVTEISLIAPTEQLAQRTLNIIEQRNEDINVFVPMSKVDALNDALRIAKNLVNEGAKVLISRKGTAAAIIEANLKVPVVAINILLSDYIESIEIARNEKGIIAFFSYEEMTDDVMSLCRMLNVDARYYTFRTDADCEKVVKKAIAEGAVLGIGGVMTQKYSDKFNFRHITIENSEENINNAIDTAKQILQIQKDELKKQKELKIQLERYKAVLNFTHDAIIAVDENGTVDVINPIAESIVRNDKSHVFQRQGAKPAHEYKRYTGFYK